MNLRLNSNEKIRINSDYKSENFVDISSLKDEIGMSIDLYSLHHYIEIRKKDNSTKMFLFKHKSDKKYYDFEWWSDAEVIFALNDTKK